LLEALWYSGDALYGLYLGLFGAGVLSGPVVVISGRFRIDEIQAMRA